MINSNNKLPPVHSSDFVKTFNSNVISEEQLKLCQKTASLFRRELKAQNDNKFFKRK